MLWSDANAVSESRRPTTREDRHARTEWSNRRRGTVTRRRMAMKREAMHALHELTLSGTEVLCVISGPLIVHGGLLGSGVSTREYVLGMEYL